MERAVLCATDLGLGTCWLGGFFTPSSFARKIAVQGVGGEGVPERVDLIELAGYAPDDLAAVSTANFALGLLAYACGVKPA